MPWPDVFLVNGASSAGKTTLCRALQARLSEPYLVVGFDDFIFMSAPRYYRGADTGRQDQFDGFTALGVELDTTSAPAGLDVLSVGVTCPIEILEQRERARGDRVLGRARGLAEVVHSFMSYDVIVETGAMSTPQCVAAVLVALESRGR